MVIHDVVLCYFLMSIQPDRMPVESILVKLFALINTLMLPLYRCGLIVAGDEECSSE